MERTKVTVIGGGTGTVAVLMGLKKFPELDLSVVVNMTDDGGSNRVVRDVFGLLPLSDLRKSIVALSKNGNGIFRKLFTYRFAKGEGLLEHTLGNLIMIALSDLTGSEQGAIDAASRIFNTVGKIIPVTFDDVRLTAEYDDGRNITGEHIIDEPVDNTNAKIVKLNVSDKAKANPEAIQAILDANYLIVGPGDLYTSVLANVIIDGIPEALQKSKAKMIFIDNLMTKKGQTHWMKANDLIEEWNKYSGRKPDVIFENTAPIPKATLDQYADHDEHEMEDNLPDNQGYQIIRSDFLFDEEVKKDPGDTLVRSLARHDYNKLANAIMKIINNK